MSEENDPGPSVTTNPGPRPNAQQEHSPSSLAGANYGMRLFPQHAELLRRSGIGPDHARARGYVSVDTKVRLTELNITPAGRNVPGLLVPWRGIDGAVCGYQYRADHPRERAGKAVKYETPSRQLNRLDVPPGVGPKLADPDIPLWITEGSRKADSAVEAGLTCVALAGVWSWRGTNAHGGKVAIPDLQDVAWNGRRVILCWDSDVARKPEVRKALDRFAEYLTGKGARVEYCHLPDDVPGKNGMDDFLAAGHTAADLMALVHPEPPPVQPEQQVPPAVPRNPVPPVPHQTASILDDIRHWLGRFVCTLDPTDLLLLVLWAAHTHLCRETYTSPRLVLDSPVPGSGKSTVLDHFVRLCFAPVLMASVGSPALLVRLLDAGMRTLLIDEADRTLAADKDGVPDLLAVLNSGYRRGATRPVLVPVKGGGWEAKEMETFAPVVMAGNNPNLPDDTRSRCIRVLLMPDIDGTAEESDWELLEDEALMLGARLAAWADQIRDAVRENRPELPDGVIGRARERWSPLKRIAVQAEGIWPAVVDALAVNDVERIRLDREEGIVTQRPAIVVLTHLNEIWKDHGAETFLPTDTIVAGLIAAYPLMWGTFSPYGKALTAQRLGRMLTSSYNVYSARPGGMGPRGYTRQSFAQAWRRMGVEPSGTESVSGMSVSPPSTTTGWAGGPLRETGYAGYSGRSGGVQDPLPDGSDA